MIHDQLRRFVMKNAVFHSSASVKPTSRRWVAFVAAAGLLLIGSSGFVLWQFRTGQSTQSQTEDSVLSVEAVTALGRLEPATEVIRVTAPANLNNDRIAELRVQRGDLVEKGKIIAVLASRDRLEAALLEAQEQVKVAQAELATVRAGAKTGEIAAQRAEIARLQEELQGEIETQQATIARWQAEVNTAQADFNRNQYLYEEGAIAADERDQKRLVLETAQAQLNEARANQSKTINTLREQLDQARATLDQISEVRPVDIQTAQAEVDQAIAAVQQAEANLAEAIVRAPISGRILEIYTNPGESISSDEGIVALGQTNEMEVVAEVYQSDIGKVQVGQSATITSSSFPGVVQGVVSQVGLQVVPQEVSSGEPGENLDRRVVEVRIRINAADVSKVENLTNLQVQVAIEL
jgi:HlyD family secretion protein